MNQFTQNDLTMAPLTAKRKLKKSDSGHTYCLFLCGVVTCTEKMGRCEVLENKDFATLELELGYGFAKGQGAWIKTKRPANRLDSHVESAKRAARVSAAVAQLPLDAKPVSAEQLDAAIDAVPQHDLTLPTIAGQSVGAYQRIMGKSREHIYGAIIPREQWPILVKCAQCGRLCKIEP